MDDKTYICECGKQFTKPNSFNGHKSNCSKHLITKYGSIDTYQKKCKETGRKSAAYQKRVQADKLREWVNEQHICETCGKIMTEKFGSGRFCGRSCANKRQHSEATKARISSSVIEKNKETNTDKSEKYKQQYALNPKLCEECGLPNPYSKKHCKFCSKTCQDRNLSKVMLKVCATLPRSLCGVGKRGWYKGYMCQSSWELAFVIYCLEHNIRLERNKKGFPYVFEGIQRTYFPDFYLPEPDAYVEIKGYLNKKSAAKADQFENTLIIYDLKKMTPILAYVETKYGKDFIRLYE